MKLRGHLLHPLKSWHRWLLLLVGSLLFAVNPVQADHIAGVDMSYSCTGTPNEYIIEVVFYRDCAGIPITLLIQPVYFQNNCTGDAFVEALPMIQDESYQEITPICDSEVSNCQGGQIPGLQVYTFRDTILLPDTCSDWLVAWTDCCRNLAISTIDDPGGSDVFIEMHIDNTQSFCNSSPQFNSVPINYLCLDQVNCINHLATDPDGDSLVFGFIAPLQFQNLIVDYLPGFSADTPLTTVDPIFVNPHTGDYCIHPSNLEVGVMGIRVDEYRDGVFLGSIWRDVQVNVIDCNNELPVLLDFDGNEVTDDDPLTDTTIVAGEEFEIEFEAEDLDGNQFIDMLWDESIPTADWEIDDPGDPFATFTWTPPLGASDDSPYCFTVTAQDDACPYNGTFSYTYCLYVVEPPPPYDPLEISFSTNPVHCTDSCESSVTAHVTGGLGPLVYTWAADTTVNDSTLTNLCAGTYAIEVTDSIGNTISGDTVVAIEAPVAAAFQLPLEITLGQSNALLNQSTGPVATHDWRLDGSTFSTDSTAAFTFSECDSLRLQLIIVSPEGCTDTAAINLNMTEPIAAFSVVADNNAAPAVIRFENATSQSIRNFEWTLDGEPFGAVSTPEYEFTECGTYTVMLWVENNYGCTDEASTEVTIIGDETMWIPNVFTPNADGFNDLFLIGHSGMQEFRMCIFNRFGEQLFATELLEQGWDGRTYAGLPAPPGIYFYVIEGNPGCEGAPTQTHRGTVTLLRN